MESGAYKLLESATQRTLHAHAFSRSSSQASSVLTDLLSRYLALVTSTCAKYAQHAGRTGLTVRDAIGALEELGVGVDELSDYCATEGKELSRYALYSARRVEDLHEFKSQLADGLRQDRDDAIPLEYARCPSPLLGGMDDEEGDEEEDLDDSGSIAPQNLAGIADDELLEPLDMDLDRSSENLSPSSRKRPPRSTTPPLPLSPVSNPSSPLRKRPRTVDWNPPDYIPNFLPPFPTVSDEIPASITEHLPTPHIPLPTPSLLNQPVDSTIEKPSVTLSQSLTTAAASDILVQVPYSQSTLSSTPEWHLPSAPASSSSQTRQPRLPVPQIEQSLLSAYHHILTHPPPPELPSLNPSRHKVAMALIKQTQTNPRWNPADTLFATVAPCPPRVATIQPSYPVAVGDTPGNDKNKEGSDKDLKLPPTASRPVAASERLAPFISQQTSRIPALARDILPPAILARTSRLTHPPVLHRGTKPLTYGSGIPAPWNANAVSSGPDAILPTPISSKAKEMPSTTPKESPVKPVLPDARLFATWDYESKDFKIPLANIPRTRNRMGSIQASGSGLISLPIGRNKGLK